MNFLQNHCRMLKLQDKLRAASLGVALLGRGDEVLASTPSSELVFHTLDCMFPWTLPPRELVTAP